jgi:hypothetical protein
MQSRIESHGRFESNHCDGVHSDPRTAGKRFASDDPSTTHPRSLGVRSGVKFRYKLVGADGTTIRSAAPGLLGGNRKLRIYGRLDCSSALRALPLGYAAHRVFFADERTAIAAGYRACGRCMRAEYKAWKA